MAPASMVSDWAPMHRQQAISWLSNTPLAPGSDSRTSKMDISLWKRAITPRQDGGQGRLAMGTRLRCPAGCSILAQLLTNQVEERPCPKSARPCLLYTSPSPRDRQ